MSVCRFLLRYSERKDRPGNKNADIFMLKNDTYILDFPSYVQIQYRQNLNDIRNVWMSTAMPIFCSKLRTECFLIFIKFVSKNRESDHT